MSNKIVSRGDGGPRCQALTPPSDRGIIYTLEGVVGLAILAVIVISIGGGLLLPVSDGELDQQATETQLEREGLVALERAKAEGAVKETVLGWDRENEEWTAPGAESEDGEATSLPDNAFGNELEDLTNQGDARVNVQFYPANLAALDGGEETVASGTLARDDPVQFYTVGTPGDRTVTVTTTVPLYNSDRLQSSAAAHQLRPPAPQKTESGEERLGDLSLESSYPIPPTFDTENVYNVVVVEVVIWDV